MAVPPSVVVAPNWHVSDRQVGGSVVLDQIQETGVCGCEIQNESLSDASSSRWKEVYRRREKLCVVR